MSLAHGDKVVRRCGRKLLRDALRGLVETRCATSGVHDWPASGFGDVKDAAVAWRGPPAGDDLERTAAAVAGLIRRRAQEPLQKLIKEGGNRRAWLDGLRQFARGARGASAALTDGTEPREVLGDAASPLSMRARGVDAVTAALGTGNRIVLTELLTAAMATISRDDKLARDAKVLRAAAKAARVLLCLRRSAHMGRSAQVLASVRAWRRHGTTDIMADYELSLVVGDDERMRRLYARRGAPPRVVPAERAQRRGRPQGGRPRRGGPRPADRGRRPVDGARLHGRAVGVQRGHRVVLVLLRLGAQAAARAGAAGDLGRAGRALRVQVRGPAARGQAVVRAVRRRGLRREPARAAPRRRRPGPRRARVPRRLPQGAGRPGPDRRRSEGRRRGALRRAVAVVRAAVLDPAVERGGARGPRAARRAGRDAALAPPPGRGRGPGPRAGGARSGRRRRRDLAVRGPGRDRPAGRADAAGAPGRRAALLRPRRAARREQGAAGPREARLRDRRRGARPAARAAGRVVPGAPAGARAGPGERGQRARLARRRSFIKAGAPLRGLAALPQGHGALRVVEALLKQARHS